MFVSYLSIAIFSYLLGSIPAAVLIGRIFTKKNFQKEGSGNLGATNALRIVSKEKGKFWGIIALLAVSLFDAGKAVIACLVAREFIPDQTAALALATFFAVLGHNYSIFLKFQGGRGAASLLGVLLFFDWRTPLAWFGTFLATAVVFEAVESKRIDKKIVIRAADRQIIGRLVGEVLALIPVYLLNPILFWPTLFATPLILIKHKDRLARQIREIKTS
jgi:glycerol-3-phosphate acyltransferase PlsY